MTLVAKLGANAEASGVAGVGVTDGRGVGMDSSSMVPD
jgi:hypothetical protein